MITMKDEETVCDSVTLPALEALHSEWPWFAIRVREKYRVVTEEMLAAQRIAFFSPMVTDLHQWSDRIKAVSLPLFAGYLFCSFDPQKQLTVLRTVGVIDILRTGSRLAVVDRGELEAICKAIHTSPTVSSVPFMAQGQRVRVTRGPLRDVEGILTEIKSRCTLVLAVTMMNRSVAVQIDHNFVEPM